MRYVHWLKINGYADCKETARQFLEIENYLKLYPKANMSILKLLWSLMSILINVWSFMTKIVIL